MASGCISFDSYIKPQRKNEDNHEWRVVYLLIPTSNHNWRFNENSKGEVVYLLIPTSNHNSVDTTHVYHGVVYLLIPTSNHNAATIVCTTN